MATLLLYQLNRKSKEWADAHDGLCRKQDLSCANEAERSADVITGRRQLHSRIVLLASPADARAHGVLLRAGALAVLALVTHLLEAIEGHERRDLLLLRGAGLELRLRLAELRLGRLLAALNALCPMSS